jgi:aminoglycoside phosphotransferase (APT) family kinase protein
MKAGPHAVTTAVAQKVLEHHFRKKAGGIQQIHGGASNFVFEASVGRDEFVLRISNKPTRLQYFMKEQWAVNKARSKGVPAPEILEVANDIIALPYMVSRKVAGTDATGQAGNLDIFQQMGEYAATINSIATSDFGHIFDWSRNRLSRRHSWKDYLMEDLRVHERVETFAKYRILNAQKLRKLKGSVTKLLALRAAPTLNHGDIRLKNMVLDAKGKISAILDWEHATSNLAPWWELAIALHDLGVDEKEAFLRGYGIAPKEFQEISPMVRVLNVLHYASVVKKAVKDKDADRLARLKQRLSGALDLYSL